MYGYFYNFNNRQLGEGLFSKFNEIGSPPPPPPGKSDFLLLDGEDFVLLHESQPFELLGN